MKSFGATYGPVLAHLRGSIRRAIAGTLEAFYENPQYETLACAQGYEAGAAFASVESAYDAMCEAYRVALAADRAIRSSEAALDAVMTDLGLYGM